ncbi:NAD(P)-dependent oxidoreductase [Paracoccus sp. (in: a-proteobacteria)]|uniref:NAD(P)-dependent oxidoreductase n=1 Tax=Paracoccus sp. TaxID=267 RepID=UPI002AFEE125|nr:NAD(P)-dependent oxidoreductase [Paracoccus sp. (in: a-proteobacteria)]
MKIGFIGLGLMGRGMAGNIQKAGHDLTVHDLSRKAADPFVEAGAAWAGSPRELASACDVVFTSLPTPADVENVGFGPDGLIHGFRGGAVWLDLSTNALNVVRDIHRRAAEKGVSFLDAPVSGGPAGAASGKLAIWAGGDHARFDEVKPVLDAMADEARFIGDIGAGTIAKLVHNMASVAYTAVLTEALTMGVKAGLDIAPLWDAIRTGAAGRMRSFDNVGRRFLAGRLDPPTFALRLVQKDIGLALQLGRDADVPMRLCNLVHQDITEAMNRGWSERDSQTFLLLQQERSGLPEFLMPAEEVEAILRG